MAASPVAISRRFQLQQLFRITLLLAILPSVSLGVMALRLPRERATGYGDALGLLTRAGDALSSAILLSAAGQLLLAVGVASLLMLFASHRIAGPLVRIRRILSEIPGGCFPRDVRLRAGDEDGNVAAALRALSARSDVRAATLRAAIERLHDIASELPENDLQPGPSAIELGRLQRDLLDIAADVRGCLAPAPAATPSRQ
ncbi:MAG: hypothetical protein HYV63_00865 [Candidatus Schekmanbacteria bacterium]|nr:hypothetical protein [Candidatus Schekmanbacteria bacterium]